MNGSDLEAIASGNDFLGIRLAARLDPPEDVWIAPIQTVSNSEGGFELVYQGSAALIGRLVRLGPGERATIAIVHRATVAADRRVEAPAAVG